jgi:hypothetical protein
VEVLSILARVKNARKRVIFYPNCINGSISGLLLITEHCHARVCTSRKSQLKKEKDDN